MREECVTITAFLADLRRMTRSCGEGVAEPAACQGLRTMVVGQRADQASLDACGDEASWDAHAATRAALSRDAGDVLRVAQAGTAARLGARFGM